MAMPDDINGGVYKDIKHVFGTVFKSIFDHKKEYTLRKSFSKKFGDHDESETHFVDYYEWFEKGFVWNSGSGELLGASCGELFELWTNSNYFISYEASQVRFKRNGGEIKRIFIFEPSIINDAGRWALMRAIIRHQKLGFSPRVLSPLNLKVVLNDIGVKSDMFGVLNGNVAYYLRFPVNEHPIMLRTVNKETIAATLNAHHRLYSEATPSEKWIKKEVHNLPTEIEKQITLDIQAIETFANY